MALPEPYEQILFSINLGERTESSGLFVTVPDKTNYYKLYVGKVIEIRPYVTYRARVGTEDWEIYSSGGVPIVYRVDVYAKKVG